MRCRYPSGAAPSAGMQPGRSDDCASPSAAQRRTEEGMAARAAHSSRSPRGCTSDFVCHSSEGAAGAPAASSSSSSAARALAQKWPHIHGVGAASPAPSATRAPASNSAAAALETAECAPYRPTRSGRVTKRTSLSSTASASAVTSGPPSCASAAAPSLTVCPTVSGTAENGAAVWRRRVRSAAAKRWWIGTPTSSNSLARKAGRPRRRARATPRTRPESVQAEPTGR
mmetsp:Transcript_46483/g.154089  ORF Transcript_46483/g.154089 Transcript_46483/m.154089 type:complete len:228 (+) Transcript_46483:175-858(+)